MAPKWQGGLSSRCALPSPLGLSPPLMTLTLLTFKPGLKSPGLSGTPPLSVSTAWCIIEGPSAPDRVRAFRNLYEQGPDSSAAPSRSKLNPHETSPTSLQQQEHKPTRSLPGPYQEPATNLPEPTRNLPGTYQEPIRNLPGIFIFFHWQRIGHPVWGARTT